MCLLFPELNEKATLDQISSFFKKDLDRLLLMSGHKLTDLTSPKLSLAPSHSNSGNIAESNIIRGLNAETMIEAIYDAVNHLTPSSKTIIVDLFIKRESWDYVQMKMHCGQNKFAYLRRKAMFEFADSFDYWQRKNKCEPIIDLHIYLG